MFKVLVIYHSQFGFTEKMAEAVMEGVKSVKRVEVELLKIGAPFSISKLNEADALIFGSPVIYGSVAPAMKTFLESVKKHKASGKLLLSGKKGGAFGSFTFSGGWVIRELSSDMESLGITVVMPAVSVVDGVGQRLPIHLDERARQKCYDLGKGIAEKL